MKLRLLSLLLGIFAILAGCGGGGGSAAGGPAPATVSSFATDSLDTDYSHVWVTIHKVTLEGPSDIVIFNDVTGRLIDLKTLRDAAGARYSFLDDSSITPATYTAVRVEMDEDLSLVPIGSSTAQARQFAAIHAVPGVAGRSQLRLSSPHIIIPGRNRVVLDFDLANWNLDGSGKVVAVVKKGNGVGLDDRRRHEDEDFHGTVSALAGTSPNQTFTMTRQGMSLNVKTDANTRVFNESGAANPTLANGLRVEVRGVFIAGVLLASAVKIEDEAGEDPHSIKGLASNLNEAAGTLDVKVMRARGFVPTRETYGVTTTAFTRFMSDGGAIMTKAEFFAALAAMGANAKVEAEGTVTGGTMAAVKLKLEDEGEHEHAEIKGPITAINAVAGTLTMTVQRWEGAGFSNGQSVNVTTSGATSFRLGNSFVNKAAFFAGVTVGTIVEAKGRFDGTTLAAIRLKDDD